jgi:hypothetical protein
MKKIKISSIGFLLSVLFFFSYLKYHQLNSNDVALRLLSFIKFIKGDAVELPKWNDKERPKMNHVEWNVLLQKHVAKTGKVSYRGFIKDKVLLDTYLDKLSQTIPGSNWTKEEQLAYWINAYNAFTVQLILQHYPIKSIKEIADGMPMINAPWDIKFFQLAGLDFDLNTIEHDILRTQFKEPRIHFALNCASISCPKLRNEAYEASMLELQFEQQAVGFIQDSSKNKINAQETKLSQIFNWFQRDFIQETTLVVYLQKYHPTIDPANKIQYLDYNWKLND